MNQKNTLNSFEQNEEKEHEIIENIDANFRFAQDQTTAKIDPSNEITMNSLIQNQMPYILYFKYKSYST